MATLRFGNLDDDVVKRLHIRTAEHSRSAKPEHRERPERRPVRRAAVTLGRRSPEAIARDPHGEAVRGRGVEFALVVDASSAFKWVFYSRNRTVISPRPYRGGAYPLVADFWRSQPALGDRSNFDLRTTVLPRPSM